MAQAHIEKQLMLSTKNEVGQLAEVTEVLAQAGVNITAICAWAEGDKACFAMLTNNNARATEALKNKSYEITEGDVVILKLENKVGAGSAVTEKIKKAGISLDYIYGTTCGCSDSASILVISCKENDKLLSILNG